MIFFAFGKISVMQVFVLSIHLKRKIMIKQGFDFLRLKDWRQKLQT